MVAKSSLMDLKSTLQSIPRGLENTSVLVCYRDIPTDSLNNLLVDCSKTKVVNAFEQRGKGLYRAMNELLEHSTGDLVFFLNSGDYFTEEIASIFEEVMTRTNEEDTTYVFDTFQRWRGETYIRSSAISMKNKKFRNIAHQAALFHGETARGVIFQEYKRIMADVVWIKGVLEQCRSVYIPRPIAILELGGISNYPSLQTMKYRYKDGGLSELIKETIKLCLRLTFGANRYYRLMNIRTRSERK